MEILRLKLLPKRIQWTSARCEAGAGTEAIAAEAQLAPVGYVSVCESACLKRGWGVVVAETEVMRSGWQRRQDQARNREGSRLQNVCKERWDESQPSSGQDADAFSGRKSPLQPEVGMEGDTAHPFSQCDAACASSSPSLCSTSLFIELTANVPITWSLLKLTHRNVSFTPCLHAGVI